MKNTTKMSSQCHGGLSRRDVLKLCTMAAVYMGLPEKYGGIFAEAADSAALRPPVIWISAQQCSGCGMTLFRSTDPALAQLIFDIISLDYHELLLAASGLQAENCRTQSMEQNKGNYILVVEGSIPVKDGGIYCKIGGHTAADLFSEAASGAQAIIAIGSCACWGGVPALDPDLTGAKSVSEMLTTSTVPVINIPGCPPNPYNFLSTLLYFISFDTWPELDEKKRPKFAYEKSVHEQCERRYHFETGRFAGKLGDDGHRKGYCLYKLGCKGQDTYNNCPTLIFGDTGSKCWSVGVGHPCFGCSEGWCRFQVAAMSSGIPPGILNLLLGE